MMNVWRSDYHRNPEPKPAISRKDTKTHIQNNFWSEESFQKKEAFFCDWNGALS